jgi:transposase
VFVIGIDPHKGSHRAAVLDQHEQLVGEFRVRAGRRQRDELVEFAARFEPRCWAIEGASGTGALLAQQLVAVGETVLDVPPTLSARARLLDAGRTDRPTRTTPAPRQWLRCVTRSFAPSCARTTPRCCGCSRNVFTT